MQITGWKKAILGVGVTIFLGAVGSGLWDIALRPGGSWFWHAVLTTVTFGSKALKDQVYTESAKGNHEVLARVAFRAANTLLFTASGVLVGFAAARLFPLGSAGQSRLSRPAVRRTILWFAGLLIIYTLVDASVQGSEALAANQAYTYFQQSLAICRPYMSDHQAQIFESRFAALRSRDEYIAITGDLNGVAQANHLRLPDFHPW